MSLFTVSLVRLWRRVEALLDLLGDLEGVLGAHVDPLPPAARLAVLAILALAKCLL